MTSVEPNVVSLIQSPTQYCSALKLNSELDSWLSVSPKLFEIERKGDKICIALLVVLINDLADCLNIGKNMSAGQVIDAAQILFDEFNQMKINDVVLCFNKIKRGHYGTIYDRLDVHVIMEKMHRFDADQTEQIEYYRQRENNQIKREEKQPIAAVADHELNKKFIRKIIGEIDSKKPAKTIHSSKSVTDQRFSGYYAQFNKIFDKQSSELIELKNGTKIQRKPLVNQTGIRFIKRFGKMMDATEFMKHKLYQNDLAQQRSER